MLVTAMHLSNEASGDSIIFDGMVLEVRGVSSETVSLFSPCEIAARQIERSKLNGWGRLREGAESYAKALASDILR